MKDIVEAIEDVSSSSFKIPFLIVYDLRTVTVPLMCETFPERTLRIASREFLKRLPGTL